MNPDKANYTGLNNTTLSYQRNRSFDDKGETNEASNERPNVQ